MSTWHMHDGQMGEVHGGCMGTWGARIRNGCTGCRERERKGVQWDVEMVGAREVHVKKGLARKLGQGAWYVNWCRGHGT